MVDAVKAEAAKRTMMSVRPSAKNIYNVIRVGPRAGLEVNKVTKKLTIKSLRPGPGDRIDVVFAD